MESLSTVVLCETNFVCIQYLFLQVVDSVYLGKRIGEIVIILPCGPWSDLVVTVRDCLKEQGLGI